MSGILSVLFDSAVTLGRAVLGQSCRSKRESHQQYGCKLQFHRLEWDSMPYDGVATERRSCCVPDCTCADATRRVRVTSHCLDDLRDERNSIPRIWFVSTAGAPLKLVRPRVRVHQEEL
jgi:hypothetical protein